MMGSTRGRTAMFAVLLVLGCSSTNNEPGPSRPGSGGSSKGSTSATANPSGGSVAVVGSTANGGGMAAGGVTSSGGSATATGGSSKGSTSATANPSGGSVAVVGSTANGGGMAAGGVKSSGGSSTASATGGKSATSNSSSGSGGTATGGGGGGKAGAATGTPAGGAAGASTSKPSTAGSTGTSVDPVKSDGCGKTPTLESGNGHTISVSGMSRTYNLKVPDSYDNSHPYRLIISYHPGGHTADQISSGSSWLGEPFYGLLDLAQGSTIFVAPQGTDNQWANSGGVDVEFSRQLISLMESEFCIDKSRILCEGFSSGAFMSYAMACAMGDVVRGVAVHSGGPWSGCTRPHDKPVAYFMTHGTNDSEVTYPDYGVPELQDFAMTNGCTSPDPTMSTDAFAKTMPTPTDGSGETPACVDFTGCKVGYPTRACIFVGGHTPAPGVTTSWVPAETWKFLSQF